MEAQRKHPNARIDPQGDKISRDSNVRYWLSRVSSDDEIPEQDRAQVLTDLTIATAEDYKVHPSTVIRGINRAQRVDAVLRTKGRLDGN